MKRVFRRLAPIVEFVVEGRTIETTLEHPFHPEGLGWLPVGSIEPGHLLVTLEGRSVRVDSIRVTDRMETVYNLEIEDHHTYFVSGDDWGFAVWAHNASVYHYTDAAGQKGMNSSRNITAAETGYDKHGVAGKVVWITKDSPDVVKQRGVKKYGLTKEKAEYVIELDIPDDQIRRIRGGRGEYVQYVAGDIELPKKGTIGKKSGI